MNIPHLSLALFRLLILSPYVEQEGNPYTDAAYQRTGTPIDGSFTKPNVSHPFNGAVLHTTKLTVRLSYPGLGPDRPPHSYLLLDPKLSAIDSVQLTTKFMILGVSRRDGASLYRSIIKLECLDFFDGQCQSIGPRADPVVLPMLNDFTDNIANAPGAVVQYVQVSADLEWMIVLWNYTTVVFAKRNESICSGSTGLPCSDWTSNQSYSIETKTIPPQDFLVGVAIRRKVAAIWGLVGYQSNALVQATLNISTQTWTFTNRSVDGFSFMIQFSGFGMAVLDNGIVMACTRFGTYGLVPRHMTPFEHQPAPSYCHANTFAAAPFSLARQLLHDIYFVGNSSKWEEEEVILFTRKRKEEGTGEVALAGDFTIESDDMPSTIILSYWPNRQASAGELLDPFGVSASRDYATILASREGMSISHRVLLPTAPGTQMRNCKGDCTAVDKNVSIFVNCSVGFYKKYRDDTSPCLPCPKGTFQPLEGASDCLPCSPDAYCPVGSSKPSTMPPNDKEAPNSFFVVLLVTIIVICVTALFLKIFQANKKIERVTHVLTKIDMFREPRIHRPSLELRNVGSISGWLVTMCGIALVAVCLWFVVVFFGSYAATPLGYNEHGSTLLNMDSQVTLQPMGDSADNDAKNQYSTLLNDFQDKAQYGFFVTFHDVRGVYAGTGGQCSDVEWATYKAFFQGCSTCAPSQAPKPRQITNTYGGTDCVWEFVLWPPHGLEHSWALQLEAKTSLFFTAMTTTVNVTCHECGVSVKSFALEGSSSPEDSRVVLAPKQDIRLTNTFVLREYYDNDGTVKREAYQALDSLSNSPVSDFLVQNWLQMQNIPVSISVSMTRSPFWLFQRAKRRAERIDLIIVLVLTSVSMYSLLRVAVKVVHKADSLFQSIRSRRAKARQGAHTVNANELDDDESDSLLVDEHAEYQLYRK